MLLLLLGLVHRSSLLGTGLGLCELLVVQVVPKVRLILLASHVFLLEPMAHLLLVCDLGTCQ